MPAPPGSKYGTQRAAVVCPRCGRTTSRDHNSAANLLKTAASLLVNGSPPMAVDWVDAATSLSFYKQDPWLLARQQSLKAELEASWSLELAERARRLLAAVDLEPPSKRAIRRVVEQRDSQLALAEAEAAAEAASMGAVRGSANAQCSTGGVQTFKVPQKKFFCMMMTC